MKYHHNSAIITDDWQLPRLIRPLEMPRSGMRASTVPQASFRPGSVGGKLSRNFAHFFMVPAIHGGLETDASGAGDGGASLGPARESNGGRLCKRVEAPDFRSPIRSAQPGASILGFPEQAKMSGRYQNAYVDFPPLRAARFRFCERLAAGWINQQGSTRHTARSRPRNSPLIASRVAFLPPDRCGESAGAAQQTFC